MNKIILHLVFILSSTYIFCQDLNLSFEDTDPFGLPVKWLIQYHPVKSALIDDTHHGKNAIRISNTYSYFSGNLLLGDYINQKTSTLTNLGQQGSLGLPIQQKINSLKGWYKYEKIQQSRLAIDSGQVIVFLRRFSESEQKSVIVGQGLLNLGKTETYKEFRVPIHYLRDLAPDTISIFFTTFSGYRTLHPLGGIKTLDPTSASACGNEFGNTCLFLTIDDLSLQFTTPTQNIQTTLQNLHISPNPVRNQTQVSWETPDQSGHFTLQITDAFGRIIRTLTTNESQMQLQTGDLPAGLYLLCLRHKGQVIGIERLVVSK